MRERGTGTADGGLPGAQVQPSLTIDADGQWSPASAAAFSTEVWSMEVVTIRVPARCRPRARPATAA